MPRPSGCLKRALLVLPWLVVLPLALELGAIGIPLLLERNNPYTLAWEGKAPWPAAGSDSELRDSVAKANAQLLEQPATEQELAAHAVLLQQRDPIALLEYSSTFARSIAIYRDAGSAPDIYSDEEFASLDTSLHGQWLAEVQSLAPQTIPGDAWNDWRFRALVMPMDLGPRAFDAVIALEDRNTGKGPVIVIRQWPEPVTPEDSPYDFAFLSYRKHGPRQDYWGLPEFRLNNYGFRDDDVEVPRPVDVFRVACVGASTTFEGPTNGFTYPNLVEHFLKQAFPGRRIEVINCGVSGVETLQERARFADYLLLDANAIVYYNAVNDITHWHQPVWLLGDKWTRVLRASRFMVLAFDRWLPPSPKRMREDFEDISISRIEGMAREASAHGARFVWCTFSHPDGEGLTPEERTYYQRDARLNWTGRAYTLETYLRGINIWNDLVREKTAAQGIPLIDVAAQLTGGGRVFGDICHMKDYGIEQKARIIAKGLEPMVREYLEGSSAILPAAEEEPRR